MTERPVDSTDVGPDAAQHSESRKDAWQLTLDDMNALADDLEGKGWSVTRIQAGHTAPLAPSDANDRVGFAIVVPGNKADPFRAALQNGDFPQYDVHRQSVAGRVFLVITYLDPQAQVAVVVAGNYDVSAAPPVRTAANQKGHLETYLQKLDGTLLGAFEHEDYEKFFPETSG